MSRTRTLGGDLTTRSCSGSRLNRYRDGGIVRSQTFPVTESCSGDYYYRTMTDEVSEHFNNRVHKGEIIMNRCTSSTTMNTVSLVQPVCYALWEKPGYPTYWREDSSSGTYSPLRFLLMNSSSASAAYYSSTEPTVDKPSYTSLVNDAYSRMVNSPSNIIVTMGELNETARLIANCLLMANVIIRRRASLWLWDNVKSIRTLYSRGQLLPTLILSDAIRHFPRLWLHIRYGLRPLIGELHGFIQTYESLGRKNRSRFTSTPISLTSSNQITSGAYTPSGAYLDTFSFKRRGNRSVTYEAYAGVICEPADSEASLAELLGVGNVIKAGWDLVPFSFVIDWFLDVGGTISRWAPNIYMKPLGNWVTVKETKVIRSSMYSLGTVAKTSAYTGFTLKQQTCSCTGSVENTTFTYLREPNPSTSVVPPVKINLDPLKVIDLFTLLPALSALVYR